MSTVKHTILTPAGRLVGGDAFVPNTTDAKGAPLVVKHGPNAGQPRVEFTLGIAIPKGAETHWNQTEWGASIYAAGRESLPSLFDPTGACIRPDFAFKVTDGDSQIPNKNNNKPCDREGYPGNWVLWFSNGFALKSYTEGGAEIVPDATHPKAVKRGYYCRIYGDISGNGDVGNPGVYLNGLMVEFVGYGAEIATGPSGDAVFGAATAAMPVGASATPMASAATIAMPAPAAAMPVGASATPMAGATPIAMPAPVATPVVTPAPDFLNPPPAAAPVTPVTYTLEGTQYTREQLIASGWSDAQIATLPTV